MNYYYKSEDCSKKWWDATREDMLNASFHNSDVLHKFDDNVEIDGNLYCCNVSSQKEGDTFYSVNQINLSSEPEDEVISDDEIKCPYCGAEVSDSWEYSDSDDEHECSDCGSIYAYERRVEVSYCSTPVKKNEEKIYL